MRKPWAVGREIEAVLAHDNPGYAPFVENVSRLWKAIFVTSAISTVLAKYRNKPDFRHDAHLQAMADYLDQVGINRQTSPLTIINKLLVAAKQLDDDASLDVGSDLEEILINQLGVGEATAALEAFCEENRQKLILLIDSVEQFPIDDFRMDAAAAGLLHLISQLRLSYSPVHICFCVPSELFHHFAAHISTNPEKDFESKLMLQ